MTNDEFFDLGRVAYITGNVKEALAAKQALETVVENANSLQQLKAEIGAIADTLQDGINAHDTISARALVYKLRQLLAV